eukprot:NODE_4170_length_831_cov_29.218750_g4012_i0.p1 GENE.NODE_4170_length_831_cov_29.218750_g4012_i0~~NODE_4170_length_831_cov_29.218750_g4012_i0.p1  ORF type:complete len:266 (+),score=59.95 NODE_4170_length_831_cov_29.218750_g4012_i0:58-798(+)
MPENKRKAVDDGHRPTRLRGAEHVVHFQCNGFNLVTSLVRMCFENVMSVHVRLPLRTALATFTSRTATLTAAQTKVALETYPVTTVCRQNSTRQLYIRTSFYDIIRVLFSRQYAGVEYIQWNRGMDGGKLRFVSQASMDAALWKGTTEIADCKVELTPADASYGVSADPQRMLLNAFQAALPSLMDVEWSKTMNVPPHFLEERRHTGGLQHTRSHCIGASGQAQAAVQQHQVRAGGVRVIRSPPPT